MKKSGIVAAAAVLLLSACSGSGSDSDADAGASAGSASASPTTPGAVPRGLGTFYHQSISWSPCGSDFCGTLTVPVDYSRPHGHTIELAVEKAPATGSQSKGALVVNPGGPGAPGTEVAQDSASYFGEPLRESYDIVGFDPRGTGDSDPVDCLSDADVDQYVAEDPDPDTAAEVKAYVGMDQKFWHGCTALSDDLVGHVSTVEAARDMDVLRAALGERKLDYFGFSYGTKLGATYATLFPKNVGRFALDGAVDPALSSRESSLHQAAGFELALRSYVQDCVDQGSCFLGDTVADGLKTIKGIIAGVDRKPLPTGTSRELQIGNAFYGLITPLYAKENWPYLDAALQSAMKGDGSVLLQLSDFYGDRENGHYTDNALEAISVINCLDDPYSIPASAVPQQYPDFEKASPTFGTVFAWGLITCRGIPWKSTDHPHLKIDGAGAAPIVVIGTTRDPATPYEEAVAMAKELESGVLLTRDGDGHTGYNRGNTCIDDAVHAYFLDGKVPQDGLTC